MSWLEITTNIVGEAQIWKIENYGLRLTSTIPVLVGSLSNSQPAADCGMIRGKLNSFWTKYRMGLYILSWYYEYIILNAESVGNLVPNLFGASWLLRLAESLVSSIYSKHVKKFAQPFLVRLGKVHGRWFAIFRNILEAVRQCSLPTETGFLVFHDPGCYVGVSRRDDDHVLGLMHVI